MSRIWRCKTPLLGPIWKYSKLVYFGFYLFEWIFAQMKKMIVRLSEWLYIVPDKVLVLIANYLPNELLQLLQKTSMKWQSKIRKS